MRVGTAWEDITPDRPLALLGQMNVRMAERTRDPLTVNAVVFEDDENRVAVLSVDVCFLPIALVKEMQTTCAAGGRIDADSVVISATHTHVAPCTTDRFVGDAAPEFLATLKSAAANAVSRAIDDLEEAEIFSGAGWLDHMGWNRRGLREDGAGHMYWGSWREGFVGIEGPRDGQVGVICARRDDGSVKAVVSSFSTHPNTLESESFYSADIPGEVRKVLRRVLGEDVGVVYLTGAAGDTAPSIMEDNPENIQPWRGELGLRRSGQYLGGEILRVIASEVDPMENPALSHEYTPLQIPIREWDDGADFSDFSGGMLEFFQRCRADWSRIIAEESPMEVAVNVIRVGDAAICTNPGEFYCLFGLEIKKRSPAKVTLIAELTSGGVGYIPTPHAIKHGGYSALIGSSKLIPQAGWEIVRETERLLGKAFGS